MISRRLPVYRTLALLASTSALSCTRTAVIETALHGDLQALRSEISSAQSRGELDADETRELANAVASRVIVSAVDPHGAELLAADDVCRSHLIDAYRIRAERHDETAAAAVAVLFEEGLIRPAPLVSAYRDSSELEWLSVAARAAIAPALSDWRQSLMRHPDERVRRAVFRAALDAPAQPDEEELLESSRVDPDPESRFLALRALGALASPRAISALVDRWSTASQEERLVIIDVWNTTPLYERAGRDRLAEVATGRGLPAVHAAITLHQRGDASTAWTRERLASVLEAGTEEEQLAALEGLEIADEELLDAVLAASRTSSARVRVESYGRLLQHPKYVAAARKQLRAQARKTGRLGLRARTLLAASGDQQVVPLLERSLHSTSFAARLNAALALIDLHLPERAALALAEPQWGARLKVACTMLAP